MRATNIIAVETTNPNTGERVKKIRAKFADLKDSDGFEKYPNGLNIFDPDRDFDKLTEHIKSLGKSILPRIRIAQTTFKDQQTGESRESVFCFISDTTELETIV